MTITLPDPAPTGSLKTFPCGFCATGYCDRCPGAIRNCNRRRTDGLWECPCKCNEDKPRKCLECKHAGDGEIDVDTWRCQDQSACQARRTARTEAHPTIQLIRRMEEKIKMTAPAKATATEPKAPKVGKCIHTGKATKGGKFAPGQDAAYVSFNVKEVLAKSKTEKAVITEMKNHGLSDALQAKFTKGLALAREKAAKKEAAEKEAKAAKAAAKADKK